MGDRLSGSAGAGREAPPCRDPPLPRGEVSRPGKDDGLLKGHLACVWHTVGAQSEAGNECVEADRMQREAEQQGRKALRLVRAGLDSQHRY